MPNRALTWATAQKIRELAATSRMVSASKILRQLNLTCSRTTVEKIIKHKTYTTRRPLRASRLDLLARKRIRGLLQRGIKPAVIAVKFDVSVSTISRVRNGRD